MLFYIFRHGETDGNVKNIVQGSGIDIPLNEHGKEQAAALRDIFADLDFSTIYCSRMTRAQQTAEIVASGQGATVISLGGLEEVHFGDAEGMLSAEAHIKYADILKIIRDIHHPEFKHVKIPHGESVQDSLNRAYKALDYIKSVEKGSRAVVASHGALMYNLYLDRFGLRHPFANCEYFVMEY